MHPHSRPLKTWTRKKSSSKYVGCPSKASYRAAITHVLGIAPSPPCIPNARCAHSSSLPMEDLTGPICCSILQQPVQLKTCQSVVCCPCLVQWLQVSEDLQCPCCYSNHLSNFSMMEAAHPLLQKILGGMKVRCAKCISEVQMAAYILYQAHYCKTQTSEQLPAQPQTSEELPAETILSRRLETPLTSVEKTLQSSLVRRLLAQSPESLLQIQTRGQEYSRCPFLCFYDWYAST